MERGNFLVWDIVRGKKGPAVLGQSIERVGGRGGLEVDASKLICDSLQGASTLTGIFLMVHHIVQRPTFLGQNGISEYSKIVPCDSSFLVPECWLGLLWVIYLQQDYLVRIIDGRHQWMHFTSLLQHTMGSFIEDVVGQVILLETWSSQLSADKGRLALSCCENRGQSLPHWQWVLLTVFAWLSWIFIVFMQVFPGVQVCQSPCSLCLFICSRTTNICMNQQVFFAPFPACCVIILNC